MKIENCIFGIRAVIEAIKSDKEIDKILVKRGLENELAKELFSVIKEYNVPMQYVPIQKIDSITRKNHQGVLAFISEINYFNIEEIIPKLYEDGKNPLILILDNITDVRNFGAIARTAECSGVHAIVIPAKGAAQVNADAIKTSAGALLSIPVCRVNKLSETVKFLKNSGVKVVAASEKSNNTYFQVNYSGPIAIILGSEETGILKELLVAADDLAKIPIFGKIESLNVSVAASVLLYEVVRQRLI